jgi:hypothetical protein
MLPLLVIHFSPTMEASECISKVWRRKAACPTWQMICHWKGCPRNMLAEPASGECADPEPRLLELGLPACVLGPNGTLLSLLHGDTGCSGSGFFGSWYENPVINLGSQQSLACMMHLCVLCNSQITMVYGRLMGRRLRSLFRLGRLQATVHPVSSALLTY